MANRRLKQRGPEGLTLADNTFCKLHGGRDMTANARYANKEAVRLAGVTAAESVPAAQAQLDALDTYIAKIASGQSKRVWGGEFAQGNVPKAADMRSLTADEAQRLAKALGLVVSTAPQRAAAVAAVEELAAEALEAAAYDSTTTAQLRTPALAKAVRNRAKTTVGRLKLAAQARSLKALSRRAGGTHTCPRPNRAAAAAGEDATGSGARDGTDSGRDAGCGGGADSNGASGSRADCTNAAGRSGGASELVRAARLAFTGRPFTARRRLVAVAVRAGAAAAGKRQAVTAKPAAVARLAAAHMLLGQAANGCELLMYRSALTVATAAASSAMCRCSWQRESMRRFLHRVLPRLQQALRRR